MPTANLFGFLFESEETYHECRACGTTVDAPDDECPNCGRTEIAEIRLR